MYTTTSTVARIECYVNGDCGGQREQRICYKGDVYLQRISPICRHPGTPQSTCVEKTTLVGQTLVSQATPAERCSNGCKDGVCL